jgi:hypothetical protein
MIDDNVDNAVLHGNSEASLAGAKKFIAEHQDELDKMAPDASATNANLRDTATIQNELNDAESKLDKVYDFQNKDAQTLEELNDTAMPKITRKQWREFVQIRLPGMGNRGQPTKRFMLKWLRDHAEQPASQDELAAAEKVFKSEPRETLLWDRLKVTGTGDKMTVEELKDVWDDLLTQAQRDQFKEDWIAYVAERRGITHKYEEYMNLRSQRTDLNGQIKELNAQRENARRQLWDTQRTRPHLSKAGEAWVGEVVDRLSTYAMDDELLRHLLDSKPFTAKELKAIRARLAGDTGTLSTLAEQGVPTGYGGAVGGAGKQARDLPMVVGVDPAAAGTELGYVPFLNEMMEGGVRATPGVGKVWQKGERALAGKSTLAAKGMQAVGGLSPFTLLDKMSDYVRQYVFLGRFDVEYQKLLELGYEAGAGNEAERLASRRAWEYTDKAQYSNKTTAFEHSMKPLIMFLPAYRQAAMYWAKQFIKNPFLFYDIRRGLNNSQGYTQAWLDRYGMVLPVPFWAQSNLTEMALPGVTAPFLIPLRMINTATGWQKDPNGGYKYTGNTKLDKLAMLAPLSFMGKNVSPLTFIDDLVYSLTGDAWLPDHASNAFTGAFAGFVDGMRKDPLLRRKAAVTFYQAQLANGQRPDLGKVLRDIFGNDGWTKVFNILGFIHDPRSPEQAAFLGAVSREAFINRVTYQQNDVGDVVYADGTEPTLLEKILGDNQVRTMADADYELAMAWGNDKAVQALFKKYPKLKQKVDYMNMTNHQKAEYLSVASNRWIEAYVTGKNYYDATGNALTAGEVYNNMKNGFILKKTYNDYLDTFDRLNANVKWDDQLRKLNADKIVQTDTAKDFVTVALKEAYPLASDEQIKQKKLDYLKSVKFHWENRLLSTKTQSGDYVEPAWLISAAGRHFGWEDPLVKDHPKNLLAWSILGINDNFYYATQYKLNTADPNMTPHEKEMQKVAKLPIVEQRSGKPYYTNRGGVEGYYDNSDLTDAYGAGYTEGIGHLQKVSDALTNLLPKGSRRLFNIKSSAQYHSIQAIQKANKPYNEYAATKLAKDEWFQVTDPAAEYEALGIHISDHEAFRDLCFKLEGQYLSFSAQKDKMRDKYGKIDYYGDAYKNAKANYNKAVDSLLSNPQGGLTQHDLNAFKNGPAGRLMSTYLVTQGGAKRNNKFMVTTVHEMSQTDPDLEHIYGSMPAHKDNASDAAVAAYGWQAVLSATISYRNKMQTVYNPNTKSVGVSAATKQGSERFVYQIQMLAKLWAKRSPRFRQQWTDIGGDRLLAGSVSMVPSMLDADSL